MMTSPHDAAAPEGSPAALHDHAIEAERHAEALATGLARISADPEAVKAVTQCADLMRQLAKGLAKQGLAGQEAHAAAPAYPPTMDGATADLHQQLSQPPQH